MGMKLSSALASASAWKSGNLRKGIPHVAPIMRKMLNLLFPNLSVVVGVWLI